MKNIRRYTIAIAVILVMTLIAPAAIADEKEYIRNVWDKFDIEFTMPDENYIWNETADRDIAIRYGMELVTPTNEVIDAYLTVCHDDSMTEKKYMKELSEYELELLEDTYLYKDELGYLSTGEGNLFMTVRWRENNHGVVSYLTVYDSCMIEILCEKTELSYGPDFTEDDLDFLDNFIRSIRLLDSYLTLEGGWKINKALSEVWYEASADLAVSHLSELEGKEYLLINVIAYNEETGDVLYLVKDLEDNVMRLVEKKKTGEKKFVTLTDIDL